MKLDEKYAIPIVTVTAYETVTSVKLKSKRNKRHVVSQRNNKHQTKLKIILNKYQNRNNDYMQALTSLIYLLKTLVTP